MIEFYTVKHFLKAALGNVHNGNHHLALRFPAPHFKSDGLTDFEVLENPDKIGHVPHGASLHRNDHIPQGSSAVVDTLQN